MEQRNKSESSLKYESLDGQSISIENEEIRSNNNEQNNYWKNRFSSILLPLIITGAPMYQLVFKNDNSDTTKEWLRSIFIPRYRKLYWIFVPINCLLIIYAILINFTIFIFGFWFLKELLIDGIFPNAIFTALINSIQIIPYAIPINLLWIKGFKFRKLIHSFDRDFNIIEKSNTKLNHTLKLGLLYVLLIFIEIVSTVITSERNQYCDSSHEIAFNKSKKINYIGLSVLCKKTSNLELVTRLLVDISFNLMIMLFIVISWVNHFKKLIKLINK
jgi:hypothetical protein